MKKTEIQWFVRCKNIARMGPFPNQVAAIQAVMTTEGVPAPETFAWPEQKPAKGSSRARS